MELEKLRDDIYNELKDQGCSIGIFEVFTHNTLSEGSHPMMRVIFDRGGIYHYFIRIESTSNNEDTRFDIHMYVKELMLQQRVLEVKRTFECKKQDSSDIARELVAYIFEIGENQLKEDKSWKKQIKQK